MTPADLEDIDWWCKYYTSIGENDKAMKYVELGFDSVRVSILILIFLSQDIKLLIQVLTKTTMRHVFVIRFSHSSVTILPHYVCVNVTQRLSQ